MIVGFFSLLEMSVTNTFFMTIFLSSYYIGILALILSFKTTSKSPLARSPFYFIRRLHTTYPSIYWDEFNQPLEHLIGAEIGVDIGNNANRILAILNLKELVLVDPWKPVVYGPTGIKNTDAETEIKYEKVKSLFSNNSKVRIIRDYSLDAAKMFDDEYFDFVYIDADHSYEAVLADLEAWYPKLKKFGVLCGDDFGNPSGVGVIEAVTEFAFEHKLLVQIGEDNQFTIVKV